MPFDTNILLNYLAKQKKETKQKAVIDEARKSGADVEMEYDTASGEFIPKIKYKSKTRAEQLKEDLEYRKMIMDLQKTKEDIKTSIQKRYETKSKWQPVVDPETNKVIGYRPVGSVFQPQNQAGGSSYMGGFDGKGKSEDTESWLGKLFGSGKENNNQAPTTQPADNLQDLINEYNTTNDPARLNQLTQILSQRGVTFK